MCTNTILSHTGLSNRDFENVSESSFCPAIYLKASTSRTESEFRRNSLKTRHCDGAFRQCVRRKPSRTIEDRAGQNITVRLWMFNVNDGSRQPIESAIHGHTNENFGLHEDRPNSWGICLCFTMELEECHRMPCCGH
jgi:hypothetical protein